MTLSIGLWPTSPDNPVHRTSGKLRLPASGDLERYATQTLPTSTSMDKSEQKRLKQKYKAKTAEADQKKALAEKARDEKAWSLLHKYLAGATQEELHIYADRSNYDCNKRAIEFILNNPRTAEATAVMIFWKLGADYYARRLSEEIPEFQRSSDHLVWVIERRVREGFYSVGNLQFDPMACCTPPGEYVDIGPIKRPISVFMHKSYHGNGPDPDCDNMYDEGIPIKLAGSLMAL
ncbi:MAG TPA: DUF4274 domain-containing protein [Accumulibacter sp.]|nr:DUF4274 domain-containing protein [Accumulibacter sp.]HQC79576.1 DUF4274 domain-containing protein [Accumulibacter sp.]